MHKSGTVNLIYMYDVKLKYFNIQPAGWKHLSEILEFVQKFRKLYNFLNVDEKIRNFFCSIFVF